MMEKCWAEGVFLVGFARMGGFSIRGKANAKEG